ncbi:CDP-glycerol glycerophosphotransferase family protein, partial [Alkalibacterium sp. 20]|uniref:CDP-glycerol glycerophosphotransferase family protein n=1 Tax=Alkalibacterium sp. 20 TaxID=1798803 RepID=UPI0015A5C8C7
IIIMPTWRMWLSSLRGVAEFRNTDYYKRYNDLINDSNLIEILDESDYELVFYPHYEIQKFVHAFEVNSTKIHLADLKSYDVQNLLKESDLLITDYSSVYFDFAYMDKPVLYYQFDYNEFRESHYSKGYFDYKKDGFGPVLSEKNKLIEAIESHIQRNEFETDVYKLRRDLFFPLHDKDNSRRNFESIMNTIGK